MNRQSFQSNTKRSSMARRANPARASEPASKSGSRARRKAADLLRQREQEFTALAAHAPDIVARIDRGFRHLYVNPAIAAATGRPPEEFIGKTIAEVGIPPDLVARWDAGLKEAFATGREQILECEFQGPSGARYYESRIVPERNAGGAVETVLVITRDFTERKKGEDELRRQKNLFAAIVDNLPVGVFIKDAKTLRYIMRNRFVEKTIGYPVETSVGKTAHDLFPKEDADRAVATDREALECGQLLDLPEMVMMGRSGEPRIHHVRKVPLFGDDGKPSLLVGIADDITERKRAEDALRQSNEFLRSVIESSRDCIKVYDLEGRLLMMSAGGQRLMEIDDVTPLLNRSYLDFWSGADRELARDALAAARAGGASTFEGSCPTTKGTPKWWDEMVAPILDAEGKPEKLLVVSRDITERKRDEQALRDSQDWLELAVESSGLALWDWNIATGEAKRQPSWEKLLGCLPGEAPGHIDNWRSRVHPEDWPHVNAALDEHLRGGTPHYVSEHRVRVNSGEWIWILDRGRVVERDAAGKPVRFIGGCEDITAQKHAEQDRVAQLVHQRDALVKEVHHRIKNSLQGVVGLLRQKTRKYPALSTEIEEAIAQLQSVALVYGLQGTRTDGLLSVAEIADAICASAENVIGGRVERTFKRSSPSPACIAGAEAVSVAVALNELVFNALKHQPAEGGEKRARVTLHETKDTAEIRIANRGRLPVSFDFEKGGAVGTGLGLVRTLLASPGGTVAFNGGHDEVEVVLKLGPPLLAVRQRTLTG
jgi:PAS domain S-box-containing protein